jgi:hypothetical protein
MRENNARNMQSNQEILNYTTQLHLVGQFCILYHDARKHEYQVFIQVSLLFDINFPLQMACILIMFGFNSYRGLMCKKQENNYSEILLYI